MNASFFLFLPVRSNKITDLESVTLSWVYKDINNELKLQQGSLTEAAEVIKEQHITVVLPGEDVLFLMAEVPGSNMQRVQQAMPYALEDSVIDDVDDLYFAINKKEKNDSENKYNVSVINKDYFESTVQQLEATGIYADVMTADYLLLNENNTLFFDGARVLFNSGKEKFSSIVESILELKKEDFEDSNINVINTDKAFGMNPKLNQLISESEYNETHCEDDPLICLVKNSSSDKVINLLQGDFKKKKDWTQTTQAWIPVSVMFGVWLLVQGGLFIQNYLSLSTQSENLKSEITKIYKQTFPKSRRIIDAKAQMEQKLTSLKKRKGQSGRSFTEMLSASAKVFSQNKGLIIKSLRYYDGLINLEIQISSLQALDKLKEKLINENGYKVEIQNASSGKDTVSARLQIKGAES